MVILFVMRGCLFRYLPQLNKHATVIFAQGREGTVRGQKVWGGVKETEQNVMAGL